MVLFLSLLPLGYAVMFFLFVQQRQIVLCNWWEILFGKILSGPVINRFVKVFSVVPTEIRDSNIFVYCSMMISFGLHSR